MGLDSLFFQISREKLINSSCKNPLYSIQRWLQLGFHLQKLQEQGTLNGVRFQLVLVERQVDRLAGYRSIDESANFKASIDQMEKALELTKIEAEMLRGQLHLSLQAVGEANTFSALFT